MVKDFLGEGWSFPIGLNADDGLITRSGDEENIKSSIRLILSTSKGERVMRPDFGCGIHDYVFEVVNTTTMALMKASIQEALRQFEPRIDVSGVTINAGQIQDGLLLISIDYSVIGTNNKDNLVWPFYLTEGN